MEKKKQTILAVLGLAVAVGLDRITKLLAVKHLSAGPVVLWDGVFELHLLRNQGAAFGILQGKMNFLIIFTIAVLAILCWAYLRTPAQKRYLPLRLVLIGLAGGGFGNLIDRFLGEGVVDFLYFKLINFPIFNVADIFATVSAFLLFFLCIFYYRDEELSFLFERKSL